MGQPKTKTTHAFTSQRPYFVGKPCPACSRPLEKDHRVIITDTPTSWFRGDDEVDVRHHSCRNPTMSKGGRIKEGPDA